jgi:phosphopantothenoylcysteine synthetase/decarboxylase
MEIRRRRHERQFIVGFALEPPGKDAHASARDKLYRKGLDLVVLNHPDCFGRSEIEAQLVFPDGSMSMAHTSKCRLARRLVSIAERALS